jgi:hypothetical protein
MPTSEVSKGARIAAAERRPAVTRLNSGGDLKGVLSGDALVNWVVKSCVAQGVPFKVTDPRAVDRVSTLLSGRATTPVRGVGPAPAGLFSESPDRIDPIGVEEVDAWASRFDDSVEHDGADDRLLSVEV